MSSKLLRLMCIKIICIGFMGKVIIDKLLRTCPGIENIYLLIRKKKGKDIHTRIDELFDDPVIHKLLNDYLKGELFFLNFFLAF